MKDILIGYGQTEVSPINNMTCRMTLLRDEPKRWACGTVGGDQGHR